MANTFVLKGKTPIVHPSGTDFAIWLYVVSLDAAGAAAAQAGLRLGLSANIALIDPAEYPNLAALAGTSLVRSVGSAVQFVERPMVAGGAGDYEIALIAPASSDAFTAVTVHALAEAGGAYEPLEFGVAGGPAGVFQIVEGPSSQPMGVRPAVAELLLPYASEPFGVYQPLIGWRSALSLDTMRNAMASRVKQASRLVGRFAVMTDERPIGTVHPPFAVDRTDSLVGRRLASAAGGRRADWPTLLADDGSALSAITRKVVDDLRGAPARTVSLERRDQPARFDAGEETEALRHEASTATVLHHLAKVSPVALKELFTPSVVGFDRAIAGVKLMTEPHPARSAFLSPIGLLHLFREYFFQLGTFLGPPVGHVWISPGGSVELVEVNTRKVTVERTVEQSTETTTTRELSQTDQDELSDAVKVDNASDMKLGVGTTASGGVTGIFQASGSASFNLDASRKQAQEQTHKKMREQSAKLASEVRQNYKTTFRTVTETTDTSSRRYVLQNTTTRLVSYELSRKMRKVAVQVQDQGRRLCWQLYVDNPGDPLGIGEFVHAKAGALDPSIKQPDKKGYPDPQTKAFSSQIPFVLIQGGDDDAEDTYTQSPEHADHGWFVPDGGANDIIQFRFDFKCPPAAPGFVLSQVTALDFHGAQLKWNPDLNVDPVNCQFTIHLTFANFGGKKALPFDVTLVYEATQAAKDAVDTENAALQATYDDQIAAAKEQQFYTTLRSRLKLASQVKARPQEDLREEERNVIYRSLIERLYGSTSSWSSADYHVASEMIRYFFDVDTMLYFVAQDWWRPRHQTLVSKDGAGELQPTIIADPPISPMVTMFGGHLQFIPGRRPYYLITDETAPAPMGASLGWLIQLDGDTHRNAFLNSPWVKAVLPIWPGREREAIAFLERPEVAGTDGLDQPYPYDPANDPPEYNGISLRNVLLKIADQIAAEHVDAVTPAHVDPADLNSAVALPTETVFAHGFDPLEGGIAFGAKPFKVFSEWTEVLPTDQVIATEYRTA